MRESPIQRHVRDFFSYRGCRVHRHHSGTFKTLDGRRHIHIGEVGEPDLLIVAPSPAVLYIETKSDAGRLGIEQRIWRDVTRRIGFNVETINEIDDVQLERLYQRILTGMEP